MLSKSNARRIDRAACLILAPLFLNEATGYRLLELPGGNPACALDPTCHRLTADQIALARPIFGDTIDYDSIMVFDRPKYFFLHRNAAASASAGNIYNTSGVITKSGPSGDHWGSYVFVHEMTHIWQYQSQSLLASLLWRMRGNTGYEYDIGAHERFQDFGWEQQAEIAGNSYAQRYFIDHPHEVLADILQQTGKHVTSAAVIDSACASLARTEEKMRQVFPARPMPTACAPAP